MRLLFIIDYLGSGGAQRQMVNLALGLTKRAHTVEFFLYYPDKDHFGPLLRDAGVQIHDCRKSSRYSPSIIMTLRNLIRRGRYDLILSFLPTPNFYNIFSGYSLISHPAIVVSERSSDRGKELNWTDKIARNLYRFADHIVVNSHHQREYLAQNYPFMQRKLSTIYNGYDLTFFSPEKSANAFTNLNVCLLVIGSVIPRKNGLCLVRALHILRKSYGISPIVSWVGEQVMAGEPLAYLNRMKREIAEYDLGKQWFWFGQRSDIVKLLRHHDVLVHPGYIEGLPNAVCEALACGRPVIVSDALDHRYLVQDGITGFLFDWHEPADLAEKIYQFATLPQSTRAEMGSSARQYAEQNLSLERYTQEFERLMIACL
jgi:glycosyltransferase involved in cell wall biosynthesis